MVRRVDVADGDALRDVVGEHGPEERDVRGLAQRHKGRERHHLARARVEHGLVPKRHHGAAKRLIVLRRDAETRVGPHRLQQRSDLVHAATAVAVTVTKVTTL